MIKMRPIGISLQGLLITEVWLRTMKISFKYRDYFGLGRLEREILSQIEFPGYLGIGDVLRIA